MHISMQEQALLAQLQARDHQAAAQLRALYHARGMAALADDVYDAARGTQSSCREGKASKR